MQVLEGSSSLHQSQTVYWFFQESPLQTPRRFYISLLSRATPAVTGDHPSLDTHWRTEEPRNSPDYQSSSRLMACKRRWSRFKHLLVVRWQRYIHMWTICPWLLRGRESYLRPVDRKSSIVDHYAIEPHSFSGSKLTAPWPRMTLRYPSVAKILCSKVWVQRSRSQG